MKKLIAVLSIGLASLSVHAGDENTGDPSRGVRIWGEQCGRCHNMRTPQEFGIDEWHTITAHMRIRAGLTGQQIRDINAYIRSTKVKK